MISFLTGDRDVVRGSGWVSITLKIENISFMLFKFFKI